MNTTAKQLQVMAEAPNMKKRLQEILGKNQETFISSMIQIVNQNSMLKSADPKTVMSAAMMAATLHLPLNNNLGFAYIVPFRNNKANKTEAQFQLGYKGFIQLAQRTGQMKTISVACVYEGQLVSKDPLKGYVFDWSIEPDEIALPVGYVAYLELINGFEATNYMSTQEIQRHATQYSQSYRKGFGPWKDHFDEMAQKTVLKALLSKYAPLSVEMQTAVLNDQAVIHDNSVDYIDNRKPSETVQVIPASEEELGKIRQLMQAANQTDEILCTAYAVQRLEDLTSAQAKEAINRLNKTVDKQQAEPAVGSEVPF